MKSRIGIDVDGVLRGFVEKLQELSFKEGITFNAPVNYEFLHLDVNGESLAYKIWSSEEWLDEVFVNSPVLEKAKSGYHMFCDDPNFEVYIVSAQRKNTEHLTDKWLLKNEFNRHTRNIYTNKKLEAPCQILIDDKPQNVQDYLDNARMGVVYTQSYNDKFDFPYRVNDLIEAYKLLK